MTPEPCFHCDGERDATTSDEFDTPLCQQCADAINEEAGMRYYGTDQSKTVREPQEWEQ